ncbi:TonB-dependent receptor [Wenyingzhuangia aestuarii]|uniref:TonB-dependent receptor n=1 Tax=Wenyingzhuangia aestuarii TaxID=1647582 RepID=UPI00143C5F93|nr:TonB-dependent receptor [Wenyingzhuangia aestuarii]NJB81567.1 outer membrane receptor protein involved in Fe transport [Wenyingzhuangia aestuarii]
MKIKLTLIFSVLFCLSSYAQYSFVVKGRVLDKKDKSKINTATVSVLGSSQTAVVNNNGEFVLELKQSPPVEITVKAIGYKNHSYVITAKEEELTVLLEDDITSLDEIVLSASRTPERVFESPVSVERMGITAIENTTAPSFYDGLENMKGVDVNTGGLTFKSVNTRGFAAIGNTRFVQLVDGMDNSSPGLNFPLGNLIGLNELDVSSVELLPGASSALYGANAFNGIMFMRSKSPFVHEGTSVYGKTGVTNSENTGVNEFVDVGVRVAKKINDRFAIKFTSSLLKGTDWFASDTRNIDGDGKIVAGDRSTIDYNGINVYGDLIKTNLKAVAQTLADAGAAIDPNDFNAEDVVSRTGYSEQDLINSDTDSFRASFSAHFKPIKGDDDTEIILSSKFGTGNTIYQGASRYALRNFIMHQHKIEIQSKHFMFRSYATIENAGDSYDIRFAGVNTLGTTNGGNASWFGTYAGAYAQAINSNSPGVNPTAAHAIARVQADGLRLNPNSAEFRTAFNNVISNSDLTQGAKFVDSSRLYHSDLNYNFKELIDFAEVQIGGSARRYALNSEGTIFTDTKTENITYDEFGIYTQLQRKFIEDRLKLTGSLRYDKAQNFDGNFSPRLSASYNVDSEKNHNIRASFQTGFRNPTTQDQYIGLYLGNTILIGSAKDNPERYNRSFSVSSQAGQFAAGGTSINFNGLQGYTNSYTRSSVEAFGKAVTETATQIVVNSGGTTSPSYAKKQAAALNAGLLQQSNIDYVKPEQVKSYEFGYRGRLSKHTVLDFSAYYSQYKDFIAIVTTVAPLYGNVSAGITTAELQSTSPVPNNSKLLLNAIGEGEYTPASLYTNTDADVASYGVNVGIETKVFGDFDFGVNYAYAKQDFDQSQDPDFETGFNTPEHKVKMSFGNNNLYKGLGFGLNVRWQDDFYWQSTFVDAQIDARTLVDLQLTYAITHWNSKVKIGGANILENEYESAPGSGTVGSQFYGSWTYNF